MGTASNIAPGLRRSSSANMAAMKSSAVVVRQSATSFMITKTTAKIEQVIFFIYFFIYFFFNFFFNFPLISINLLKSLPYVIGQVLEKDKKICNYKLSSIDECRRAFRRP